MPEIIVRERHALCRIYSATNRDQYDQVLGSVSLHGAVTSIRLAVRFWAISEEIARQEDISAIRAS